MVFSRLAVLADTWNGVARARRFHDGPPSRSRPGVRFFKTKNAQYRYLVAGEAEGEQKKTIVFLADAPATIEFYDEAAPIFAKEYRVIVFEAPAMGFSAAFPSFGFGFKETNDDFARFLEAVAGMGAILAFSCGAGLGAVDIACRRPELVSALTLFQTTDWETFARWKDKRDPKRILAKPFIGQLAMRRIAVSRAPKWFDLAVGRRECVSGFCACAGAALDAGAGWALASAFQRYLKNGASPLGAPTQPTLIVWGDRDGSHDASGPVGAAKLAPGAVVRRLPGVGHFPELEAPSVTFGIVDEFLRQNLPARAA